MRSSATAEDLAGLSFAGRHDTVLTVSEDAVVHPRRGRRDRCRRALVARGDRGAGAGHPGGGGLRQRDDPHRHGRRRAGGRRGGP
ncbi:PEP/pyruvate-binding domain-containing protein [Lentzea sp. BCCO 10_0798]|uniref:PEP/pyruvate-binding domain-containing protein n=1 Tax=Lentzea kristufekii TaxID=3095430 RepID=A0ABU4U072_9PSEU|nr:PEP/pyruvate-binding domain-containing protein [Lentzea sp. BCCO 10_0798]MDX8053906.1 PEP/pyruvate-binding domain-containing protein [Lentzea sp. BCCO 10_0798]